MCGPPEDRSAAGSLAHAIAPDGRQVLRTSATGAIVLVAKVTAGFPLTAAGWCTPRWRPNSAKLRGVTPNGERWLAVRQADQGSPANAVVINFFEELRAKVRVK